MDLRVQYLLEGKDTNNDNSFNRFRLQELQWSPISSKIDTDRSMWIPQPHILDIRSLTLFRIGLGCYLCYDVVSRLLPWGVGIEWYTTPGFLDPNDSPHGSPVHKIWFARTSAEVQYILFGFTFLLSVLLALGKLASSMSMRLVLWVMECPCNIDVCMYMMEGAFKKIL